MLKNLTKGLDFPKTPYAPAARSPSTVLVSAPRSKSMLCPSGSCTLYGTRDSNDIPFHLCKPVDVQADVCDSLKNMFANNWPVPTPQAMDKDPVFCQLYNRVKARNLPNALGARVLVPSGLNIKAWINTLYEYHDNQICNFLAFGWPIGYYSSAIPKSVTANHPSATAHPSHVHTFIQEEKQHQALAGPFDSAPFQPWTRLSPLMSRP